MEQIYRQALEDINLEELRVNQAFLNITSHQSDKLWMYTLSNDCIRVSLLDLALEDIRVCLTTNVLVSIH